MNHFLVVCVGDRLADAQKDVQALRQEFPFIPADL